MKSRTQGHRGGRHEQKKDTTKTDLRTFLETGVEPDPAAEEAWDVAFLTQEELNHLWLLHKKVILKSWRGSGKPWAQMECEKILKK